MKLFGHTAELTMRRKILLVALTGLLILSIVAGILVVAVDRKNDNAQPLPTDEATPIQQPGSIQPKTINGVGGVSLPEDPQ